MRKTKRVRKFSLIPSFVSANTDLTVVASSITPATGNNGVTIAMQMTASGAPTTSTVMMPSMSGLLFTDIVMANDTMTTTTLTFNGTTFATPSGFEGLRAETGSEFGGFRFYGAITAIGVMTVLFAEF